MSRLHAIWLLACLATVAGAAPPDVIFVGGNIYTLDPARPRAAAIAVSGGRIVAVGSDAVLLKLRGPKTRVIQFAGGTVLPGLIDAHGHLAGLGSLLTGRLDLVSTRSYEQLVAAVKAQVAGAAKGKWILGGRWDQANWGQKKLPTHDLLSSASADHPVWLTRVDGHSGLANKRAMALAGITRDTPDPAGGHIMRDAKGEATGVFVDNAMGLISRAIRGRGGKSLRTVLLAAQKRCLSRGLTGVHDAGISPFEVGVLKKLAASSSSGSTQCSGPTWLTSVRPSR